MTPPTSRSSTFTNLPCSLTTRDPLRHFVTNNELPGRGPSEAMGNSAASPSAPAAAPNIRKRKRRRPSALSAPSSPSYRRSKSLHEALDVFGARLERLAFLGERSLGEELARRHRERVHRVRPVPTRAARLRVGSDRRARTAPRARARKRSSPRARPRSGAWRAAQRWRSCGSSMRRQTNNRAGIPMRSATSPSVIGPMRPRENPPGSSGSDR